MKLKILSVTFPLFYEELTAKASKLITSKRLKEFPANTTDFWLSPTKKDNTKKLIEVIFGNYSETYWRDRKSKHSSQHKKNGADAYVLEQVHMMFIALKFMGYKLPNELNSFLLQVDETKILYQQFLEKNFPNLSLENPDEFFVYDFQNKRFRETGGENNGAEQNLDNAEKIPYAEINREELPLLDQNVVDIDDETGFDNPMYSVVKFFSLMQAGKFKLASKYFKSYGVNIVLPFNIFKAFCWTDNFNAVILLDTQRFSNTHIAAILYVEERIDQEFAFKMLALENSQFNLELLYKISEDILCNDGAYPTDYPFENAKMRTWFYQSWDEATSKFLSTRRVSGTDESKRIFIKYYSVHLKYISAWNFPSKSNRCPERWLIESIKPYPRII